MDYTYDFGTAIKEARKKKKYTQERLASAIDVTYASISKYESNAISPSLEVMCKISDVLGVSMDKLCGFEDSRKLSMHQLNSEQVQILTDLAELFRDQNISIKNKLSSQQYEMLGRITESFVKNR